MREDLNNILPEVADVQCYAIVEQCKIKRWLSTAVAFANESGGILVFGVDEEDVVRGIDNTDFSEKFIAHSIEKFVSPVPPFDISVKELEGRKIVTLHIEEGRVKPYSFTGDSIKKVYVRDGGITRIARSADYHRLRPRQSLYGRNDRYKR